MLAARITLPHFSVSSATSLPKSAGKPGSVMPPASASRAFKLGSARAALMFAFNRLMISSGVLLGAHAIPRACLTARDELAHCRHLQQFVQTYGRSYCQRAQLSSFDIF